jgi:hypothetical protein
VPCETRKEQGMVSGPETYFFLFNAHFTSLEDILRKSPRLFSAEESNHNLHSQSKHSLQRPKGSIQAHGKPPERAPITVGGLDIRNRLQDALCQLLFPLLRAHRRKSKKLHAGNLKPGLFWIGTSPRCMPEHTAGL